MRLDRENTFISIVCHSQYLENENPLASLKLGMERERSGLPVVEGVEGMWKVLTINMGMLLMAAMLR